eukprot:TRINITY_DN3473_c0_g1_i1.p1 TRINITY_DN3473_c0_g1~~TRINITY_DN3473_c0_g1_i1.p1  ORF type:complete len:217 (+),score=51.06 TRINITY_DN3473_c0_g1_i1:103-753(+)
MASRKQQVRKQQRKTQKRNAKIIARKQEEQELDLTLDDNDNNQSLTALDIAPPKPTPIPKPTEDVDSDSEAIEQDLDVKYIVANDLRKGKFVLLRKTKEPCKIVELNKSKTGKHGGAKIRVVGLNVFNGKKYDDIFLSKSQVEVPVVKKIKYNVVNIKDNIAVLKDPTNDKNEKKVKLNPDIDIHAKILDNYGCGPVIVTLIEALNEEAVEEVRAL